MANREIKFRAWDRVQGEMRTWDDLLYPTSKYYSLRWLLQHLPQDHKHELMQFTGLKDRLGVEIYEGDVITFDVYDGDDYCTWQPRYLITDLYRWAYLGGDLRDRKLNHIDSREGVIKYMETADLPDCTDRGFTVVGNIHESPELLEAL
jgi:hypothetical protein